MYTLIKGVGKWKEKIFEIAIYMLIATISVASKSYHI